MAVGGGDLIFFLEGKKKWGWCGFEEMLQYLLSPFTSMKQEPTLEKHSFSLVVAGQGDLTTFNGRGA